MGYIVNTGSIKANKPFTSEARDICTSIVGRSRCRLDELVFDEYYDRYFEETVAHLIHDLKPLGYVLNGYVSYYGDYDGAIEIQDNELTIISSGEMTIKNATDELLINEIKFRGYKVFKEM